MMEKVEKRERKGNPKVMGKMRNHPLRSLFVLSVMCAGLLCTPRFLGETRERGMLHGLGL